MSKPLYPNWVLKHKTSGTAIVKNKQSNFYYLYQVSSKWDKHKRRAQKITEKYLGKITIDGLIAPIANPKWLLLKYNTAWMKL